MTKENNSIKENKSANFKTWISVLKPIRDWLRSSNSQNVHPNLISRPSFAQNQQPPKLSPPPHQQYTQVNNHSYNVTPSRQRHTPIVNESGLVTMDDLSGTIVEPGNTVVQEEHFKRNAKARMSLPIMQQRNEMRRQAYSQLQWRGQQEQIYQSLGRIYLQYNGETKQANLPNELTAIDTIRALFVCAFPNLLSMSFMSQPHVKIYIYNPSCNIFYELYDICDVKHESVLRIHQSYPIYQTLPPPQYQHHTMRHITPSPGIPPPKPRRMVATNELHQSRPNVIYEIPAQALNRSSNVSTPLQFHQNQYQ